MRKLSFVFALLHPATCIFPLFQFPFNSDKKRMTTVVKKGNKFVSYVKGAPDLLLAQCEMQAASCAPRGQLNSPNTAIWEIMARPTGPVLVNSVGKFQGAACLRVHEHWWPALATHQGQTRVPCSAPGQKVHEADGTVFPSVRGCEITAGPEKKSDKNGNI